MARVVHFELFSGEPTKLVDFYRDVFGWDVSSWEGPFEYHLATTGPDAQPGINGAIAPFGGAGTQPVVLTMDVADLDTAAAQIIAAGGTEVTEKNVIPDVGWQQYFRDPSGTVFGVLQPDMAAMPGRAAGEGAVSPTDSWAEVGDRLRDIGVTIGQVVQNAADSPQGKQLREQADKAATAIGDASKQAADKARPHVISALDRVSLELGELATKLRQNKEADEAAGVVEPVEPAEGEAPEGTSGDGTPE